jgi:hypothetical protein
MTARAPCSVAQFREMVRHLRKVCPVPTGCYLTVKRVQMNGCGICCKTRKSFLIEINRGLTVLETEHILLHEWAHMYAWRPHHPLSGDHGSDWGVWYSRVWRQYYGST